MPLSPFCKCGATLITKSRQCKPCATSYRQEYLSYRHTREQKQARDRAYRLRKKLRGLA
jgi:hypothetical protein